MDKKPKPVTMTQELTTIENWTKCLACYARNHAIELWLLGFPIPMILVGLSSLGFKDISPTDIETLLTETGHDISIRKEPKDAFCQPLPHVPKPKILNRSSTSTSTSTSHHRTISPSRILTYWRKGHTISEIQMNLLLAGTAGANLPSSQEIIDVLVDAGCDPNPNPNPNPNLNPKNTYPNSHSLANNPWKKYQFFAEEIEFAAECSCAYSTAQVVRFWKQGYTVPDIVVQLGILGYEDVFVEDVRLQLMIVGLGPEGRSEEKGAWRGLRRRGGGGVRFRRNGIEGEG